MADAIQSQSRLGYFAALYNRVTMAVRDGIHAGAFDDTERMARLDVVFANRSIAAYEQFRGGGRDLRAARDCTYLTSVGSSLCD